MGNRDWSCLTWQKKAFGFFFLFLAIAAKENPAARPALPGEVVGQNRASGHPFFGGFRPRATPGGFSFIFPRFFGAGSRHTGVDLSNHKLRGAGPRP